MLLNQKFNFKVKLKNSVNKKIFSLRLNKYSLKILDNQELKLSKKLVSSYKQRLEKEIYKRSIKLKMPQKKYEEIIKNNNELINLKKALEELETIPQSSN